MLETNISVGKSFLSASPGPNDFDIWASCDRRCRRCHVFPQTVPTKRNGPVTRFRVIRVVRRSVALPNGRMALQLEKMLLIYPSVSDLSHTLHGTAIHAIDLLSTTPGRFEGSPAVPDGPVPGVRVKGGSCV